MKKNNNKFYEKHFKDLAEQHRQKYEYYKNKAKEFANHAKVEVGEKQ